MSNTDELKNYFKKLQRVLRNEGEFTFIDIKLIKKNVIDDILCCIIATFPDSYKKIMRQKEGKELRSVMGYNVLLTTIKRKFFLNNDLYLVKYKKAINVINSVLVAIEKDIAYAEKNVH